MMVTQINELIVRMDTSSYEAGGKTIETVSDKAGSAQRALAATAQDSSAKISQAGDWVEKLKRRTVDGYAAMANLNGEVTKIARAFDLGRLSASEMSNALDGAIRRSGQLADVSQLLAKNQIEAARAVEMANQRFQQQRSFVPANRNQPGPINTANIAAQFQDIGVTAAMGMTPLQIALQQGTQLSAAFGSAGAAGAVRSLGAAFASLVSPVSLMTIGFVAAAAAAIQYFMTAEDGTEKSKKLLDEQNDTIRRAAQLWGDAVPAFRAYVDELDRVDKLTAGRDASEILAGKALDGLPEKLGGLSGQFAAAMRSFQQGGVDPASIRDFRDTFSSLFEKLDDGTASSYEFLNAQRAITEALATSGSKELRAFAAAYAQITSEMYRGIETAQKAREAWIKSVAGGSMVQDIVENSQVRVGDSTFSSSVFIPKNPPVPTERPKIELEGGPDSVGARADLAAQVESRQTLMRTQQDEMERMRLEARLIGASARERATMTSALNAEMELRRQGISVLSAEGRAYIANAQAIAAARIETERLNQLAVSRDPAGERSNIQAQVQARQALYQSQREEMDALKLEAQLIGASTKERAVLSAAMQAEQQLRRQGISVLSEEGKAYVENAKSMAAARVEVERQNQLALSRDPAGQRSNIADQVQARQQLFQAQSQELEKLRLEAQLIGATESQRARATAALQAEQQLRQQGINILSQEGQAYIANAQAIAQARLEIERQNAAFASLQQAGGSAIDSLVVGTGSLKDRIKAAADTMLQWIQQLAIANPLKNALFGSNLPTLGDLFSGKPMLPGATTTGMMTVTAGTVMVNGGVTGNLAGNLFPSAPGSGTLSSFLGIPANQNVVNGVRPTLTPSGVVNSPVSLATVNGVRPDLMAGGLVNSPTALRSAAPTDIEAYIRQSALTRGIDPDVAVRVAQSEGGLQSWNLQSQAMRNGIQEPSFGPFQLLKGGQGTGYPVGLGNDFMNQTGLDPALAANGPQGVDFALDHASRNGWSAWYGARNAGINRWQGIGQNTGVNPGVDTTTTNSISQTTGVLKQFSTTTAAASKDVGTLGDTTSKLGTQLTDSLGKIAAPTAVPPVPAVAPAAPATGGGIFSSLFGSIFKLFGFADGTEHSPGGWAMVGERGPEPVFLPRGSQVIPNHRTNQIFASGGGMQGGGRTKVDVAVAFDKNGNLEAYVRGISDDSAANYTRAGIAAYDAVLPDRLDEHARNPDFRSAA